MDKWIYLAAIGALLVWTWWKMRRDFARETMGARAVAAERGIDVSEVDRQVYGYTGRFRATTWRLQEARCTRYALLVDRTDRPHWALLMHPQRDGIDGMGWQFPDQASALSDAHVNALHEIAADWKEGFLELEGESGAIAAYWDESGGVDQASLVCGYLERMRSS